MGSALLLTRGCVLLTALSRLAGGVIYISDRAHVLAAITRAANRSVVPDSCFRARALDDVMKEARRLTSSPWPVRDVCASQRREWSRLSP